MATRPWRTELQDILAKSLNEDQVRLVCFDLALDYNRLKGQAKPAKVAALVEFCERRALISQLRAAIRLRKPDVRFETDVADAGSRVKVEIQVKLDILSFGNQKEAELLQAIAEQFDVEQDEIHVLFETTGSTRIVIGMSRQDAEKLVSAYAQKDSRFKVLDKIFGIQRIRMAEDEPKELEKLSLWRSHRFRGALRLLLHLSGFPILILGGLALARFRVPQMDVFNMILALLRHDFSSRDFRELILWTVLGALPGVIAWAALPLILAKFMQKVYAISSFWDAFEYMFLCIFGPLVAQYPLVYVKEGKVDARSQALPQGRPDGPGGPCRFVVLSDSAIVVERGGRRMAVVGPSVHTAGRFEKIQQAIDLRPQTRVTTASLITRDGIPVKVRVGATFRIRWQGEPTAKVSYPADPDALLQAAAGQAVFQFEGGKPELRNWADRVSLNLDSTLRAIVARYRLDELLEPRDPGVRPRSDLERNYTEDLKKIAGGLGAEITEVRLGAFEFDVADLAVNHQWMDTWRIWWDGQARVRKAHAEASAIRTREMARAYAQLEMIGAITREFQSLAGDESIPIDLITLRFVEVISQMATKPESALFLPHEVLQTLDGVRKMLQEAKGARKALDTPKSGMQETI
jgi:regulator of protease activity HflC (stomatin/prohibitin superfamily)